MLLSPLGEEIYIDDKIIIFAMQMQKELDANYEKKGSIYEWCNSVDFDKWLYEFEYHKAKLIASLMAKDDALKNEFTADLANYLVALMFRPTYENIQRSFTLTQDSKTKIIETTN